MLNIQYRDALIFCLVLYVLISSVTAFFNRTNTDKDLDEQQIIPWGVELIGKLPVIDNAPVNQVNIAVMDSGINYRHPDFSANIKQGFNVLNPELSAFDDYGHGTLVAGVIAAQNNSIGIVGIAPDVALYPVKVLNEFGEGDLLDITTGIDWCIENNMDIINMSFAVENDDPILRQAIRKAVSAGIIIVASAMNSYGGDVGYPASYEGVISVTAVDKQIRLSETAPRGKIDFAAPGVNILSTTVDQGYEMFTGTSIAAPHITGMIAMILRHPQPFGLKQSSNINTETVLTILKKYVKHRSHNSSRLGNGLVSFHP
jgi:subtilisin family serine protease